MILRFNDGLDIDTSGELRIYRGRDGWYVLGHGCSIPCSDKADAEDCLRMMRQPQRQSNR